MVMIRSLLPTLAINIVGVALSACAVAGSAPGVEARGATRAVYLVASDGSRRGLVTVQDAPGASTLTVNATGLSAGIHGLHLHAQGRCEGPGFASAGGHWNPTGRKHGRDNPAGAHLGDLPNLAVDATGSGVASFTLAPGWGDADGTALVIHAKADDYRTDPSGNSGDRVACAVIAVPR
jgi:Cu-Zn family superoxide dismutase